MSESNACMDSDGAIPASRVAPRPILIRYDDGETYCKPPEVARTPEPETARMPEPRRPRIVRSIN